MDEKRPELPIEQLHAAAESATARAHIDALHAELSKERPSAEAIASHVERLREQPRLLALISNWFDDPRVQTFLTDLSAAGL
jgi:hypothetical protein